MLGAGGKRQLVLQLWKVMQLLKNSSHLKNEKHVKTTDKPALEMLPMPNPLSLLAQTSKVLALNQINKHSLSTAWV